VPRVNARIIINKIIKKNKTEPVIIIHHSFLVNFQGFFVLLKKNIFSINLKRKNLKRSILLIKEMLLFEQKLKYYNQTVRITSGCSHVKSFKLKKNFFLDNFNYLSGKL